MAALTDIRMPEEQEGTKSVVRTWLKQVGDRVACDEPLVELETDKVAVEVPAPADGVLESIAIQVGDEAAPGALLGTLSSAAAAAGVIPGDVKRRPGTQGIDCSVDGPWVPARATRVGNDSEKETRLSPLVRRLLADNKLDARQIKGSGREGRITHADVEALLTRGDGAARLVPHDIMRKSIAEHMAHSLATAPHVTAVFEADFSAVSAHRQKHKAAFEQAGAPLTYSAYIVAACAAAMQASPRVNSRWRDDALEMFDDVNVGIGVSLGDKGLIVPVIRAAQTLSLQDVARQLGQLTDKARAGKLAPAEVQGGSFTISNHGVSGSLIAAPIVINQGQAAILGIGKLEKRVVVREIDGADAILIRPMAYVSLTIDHRVLDGHQTNAWLTRFVDIIENWPEDT